MIGRVHGDWVFDQDDAMSSRHAQFMIKQDQVFFIDLGSTNGSFLNKKQLEANTPAKLNELDIIQVGSQELIFTTQANFNPDQMEDLIAQKKREELRSSMRKAKEGKLKELMEKKTAITTSIADYREKLENGQKKFDLMRSEYSKADAQLQKLLKNFEFLRDNMEQEKKRLEESKSPYYTKKTGLKDKEQLMKLAGKEEELAEIQNELAQIEEQINQIEGHKKGLPDKLKKFELDYKEGELNLQKQKLKNDQFESKLNDFKQQANAKLSELQSELELLEVQIIKTKEETAKYS